MGSLPLAPPVFEAKPNRWDFYSLVWFLFYSHFCKFFEPHIEEHSGKNKCIITVVVVNPAISEKWKKVKSLSRVRLFATPWTVAYQAPPFMGFSRQEYWSAISEVSIKQTKHVLTKSETYWVSMNIFITIWDTGNTRSAVHIPKSCLDDGFCPICSVNTANEVAAFSVWLGSQRSGSPKRLSDGILWICLSMLIKRDFLGGPVVENPPVCAGDMGLFDPWPGKIPRASRQLSITATEACTPRAIAPQQEKPLRWKARTPQLECSPAYHH